MKLGIMQPYFLPYIGYWQLLNLVDLYVIYDDVNYIKNGYVNRNNVLLNSKSHIITLPLDGASPNKKINQINVNNKNIGSIFRTIRHAYSKAPFFSEMQTILEEILYFSELNLASYVSNSIVKIASYLEINTKIILSSEIEKNIHLKNQDKVIDICKKMNARQYINSVGGISLYDRDTFKKNNIDIKFLKVIHPDYIQFKNSFVSNLSIIDLLMFNSKESVKKMLNSFTLS